MPQDDVILDRGRVVAPLEHGGELVPQVCAGMAQGVHEERQGMARAPLQARGQGPQVHVQQRGGDAVVGRHGVGSRELPADPHVEELVRM